MSIQALTRALLLLVSYSTASAVDTYNPATNEFTAASVQLGGLSYSNVVATVGSVVGIGSPPAAAGPDIYNPDTGELFLPEVTVSGQTYHNLLITLGAVRSAAGPVPIAFHSVSTNLDNISYPSSYQVTSTVANDFNTDPCKLNLDFVTYPAAWLGNHPLPTAKGYPLKTSLHTGMVMKDIMLHDNPAFVTGCSGSLPNEFARTISRLKKLGVEYLYITQWHWMTMNPDGSWHILPADGTYGPLSDSDLTTFVNTAHAAGMKVVLYNQIQMMTDNYGTSGQYNYIPTPNEANFSKWLTAFKNHMVSKAAFVQSIGVDVWEMGCNVCLYNDWGDGSATANSLFASAYTTMTADVKKTYTGKTYINTAAPWLPASPTFVANIDFLKTQIYAPQLTAEQSSNLTVDSYKSLIANTINGLSGLSQYGKAVMVDFGVQSRGDALLKTGYLEETGCTSGIGDLNISNTCTQKVTPTDFSLQAIIYEATLEALNGASVPAGSIIFASDYWQSDSLIAGSVFPNIGSTIRNKPAEGILKLWFSR